MEGNDRLSGLDLAFSCSYWTENHKISPNEVIQAFVEAQERIYQQNLDRISHRLDISYGGQKLDLWGVNEVPKFATIFVFLHGGYWQEGNKKLSTSFVEPLVRQGIGAAIVGYDLAPAKNILQSVHQVMEALQWMKMRYPDSELILAGHSAGAHLLVKAIEMSSTNFKINKIVLFCGIYSNLEELVDTYIGRNMGLNRQTAFAANINIEKFAQDFSHGHGQPRILLLNAEHDAPKIKQQNKWMEDNLKSSSIDFKSLVIAGTNHFSMIEGLNSLDMPQTKVLLEFSKD